MTEKLPFSVAEINVRVDLWSLYTQKKTWCPECSIYEVWARSLQDCFPLSWVCAQCLSLEHSPLFFLSSALNMASVLQKLITPLFSGPPEPPRNKVTVVGVGQVGMACAISILLRVRAPLVPPLLRLPSCLLVSQDGVIPRILLDWPGIITDLLVSDLTRIPSLCFIKFISTHTMTCN